MAHEHAGYSVFLSDNLSKNGPFQTLMGEPRTFIRKLIEEGQTYVVVSKMISRSAKII